MVIQIDSRQKDRQHNRMIEQYFLSQGCELIRSKMLVGDYCIPSRTDIVVDTKQNCEELYKDLISDHKRFSAECQLANKCGIKLYILVVNEHGFTNPQDITKWNNPQNNFNKTGGNQKLRPPISSTTLLKIMNTMTERYKVEFVFCSRKDVGRIILDLLSREREEK